MTDEQLYRLQERFSTQYKVMGSHRTIEVSFADVIELVSEFIRRDYPEICVTVGSRTLHFIDSNSKKKPKVYKHIVNVAAEEVLKEEEI